MDNIKHLGEERVFKLILRYSAPAIAGMVIYGLNRIVGNIFVGKFLGREAMAGFTVANSVVTLVLACVMLVGTGSSVLISISLGKKDADGARRALGTAIAFGAAFGVALTVAGELFAGPLLAAFGGRGEALGYGKAFIRAYLLGNVFAFQNTTLNGAIRAEGHPALALVTNVVSFTVNTALIPVFLFAFPLGIRGIAVANVIAQFIVMVWLGAYFGGKRTMLPIRARDIALDRPLAARMVSIGLAPFFMQFLGACISLVTNNVVRNLAGTLGLAAMGAVSSVYFLLIMPLQGTSTGIQPIIGYNFGADLRARVRRVVSGSLVFVTVMCVAEAALAIGFRRELAGLFTSGDAGLVDICSRGLALILCAFPLVGVQFVASSYFLATGKSSRALAVNLLRSLLVLLPIFILPPLLGLNGLFVAYPATDAVVTVVAVLLLCRSLKKKE